MLQRGPQGPTHVASEKSSLFPSCEGHAGIALESLLVNRTMSRVLSVNSAFISGGDRDLRLQLKVHLGSQASSGVEASNFAFCLSCQRGDRPPVEFMRGIWAFSRGSGGESHHVVRGYSVFHWSWCKGIRTYLELKGNSVTGESQVAVGSLGFLSSCDRISGTLSSCLKEVRSQYQL